MKIRSLTEEGNSAFADWLQVRKPGELPPRQLLDGDDETVERLDVLIDSEREFSSRFEFGQYMAELLKNESPREMLVSTNDGMWNWIVVLYFAQFGRKTSKYWHYLVTRSGHSGSLAYRHLARTSYEMYWRHEQSALVMLSADMWTWGDISEQLTSRQNVAYHRGYMAAANALYMEDGKPRRGAAGRVPPLAKRKAGDRRGKGGAGRLALAVRRLCRTYDTHAVDTAQMIGLLPREFEGFLAKNKVEKQP